jgi:thymidylate kinase
MIISFSGNDGSGKTTIGNSLVQMLSEKHIPISYKHEYDYMLIKYLFKLVGEKRVSKQRDSYLIKQDENPLDHADKQLTLFQKFWPYVVWADNLLTILYYKIFYRKRVIFLDRYPYDMYLSFVYMGRANRFMRWLFLSIPKADTQIIFFAEPATAMERKKHDHNYPISFYHTQLNRYKALAHAKNIEMHRTEEPFEETMKFVLRKVYDDAPAWVKREFEKHELQRD